MPLIRWSDQYSVGVPGLDAQHRQLIDALNELHEAMSAARGQQVLGSLLERLGQYARTHLETEENFLKTHGYPAFAQHKAQHDAYGARVREMQQQLRQGRVAISVSLMAFLKEWWTTHILNADRQYAEFLKSRTA